MLLMLAARPSIAENLDESFSYIEKNDPAPYTGYIFTTNALAKIYSDIEQEERTKKLEFETKLQSIQLQISKLNNLHKIELDNKDLLLENITKEKNKVITDLSTKIEIQKWLMLGTFLGGVIITGATVYYVALVIK